MILTKKVLTLRMASCRVKGYYKGKGGAGWAMCWEVNMKKSDEFKCIDFGRGK